MKQNSAKYPQKGAKRGFYTSGPVQDRVVTSHLTGKSNRGIAREEGLDPKTVARILTQPEVKERMIQYRQRLFSLAPKAIGVFDEALSSRDERIRLAAASKLIEGLNVMPRGHLGDISELASPEPNEDDRYYSILHEFTKMMFHKCIDYDSPLPDELAKLKAEADATFSAQGKSVNGENDLTISETLAVKKPAKREVGTEQGKNGSLLVRTRRR